MFYFIKKSFYLFRVAHFRAYNLLLFLDITRRRGYLNLFTHGLALRPYRRYLHGQLLLVPLLLLE